MSQASDTAAPPDDRDGMLSASATAMRDLINAAPTAMGVLRYDANDFVFELSNSSLTHLGCRGQLTGKRLLHLYPNLWRFNRRLASKLRKALQAQQRFFAQAYPIRVDWDNDGFIQERFLNIAVDGIFDDVGALTGARLYAYDAHAQVLAHRAAQSSETDRQRLASLVAQQQTAEQQIVDILEGMRDAFFSVDRDWKIVRVNAHQERLGKLKREEQIGKNFIDLYLPNAEHKKSQYWAQYHRVMRERVSVAFEDYYPQLAMWTSVDAYPTPDGGMAVFYRDITEQKTVHQRVEAERQKFEAIFVDSPACMALLRGPALIFEKANPKFQELMGKRELIGKPFHEALSELSGQPFHGIMTRVFHTGEAFHGQEVMARLVRSAYGKPEDIYFDFTNCRVEDGSGNPYGVYIHAIDVTDKVMARRKVEKLAEDLRGAVRVRDDFLSIASHELKTPITSLRMQLEMTRRKVNPETNQSPPANKLAQVLDVATRQIERLTILIEDLLDISRIETGKMAYSFERVDLATLAREVVERFNEQLIAARCPTELDAEDHIMVIGDRFRIEQVITNLLTNAIKYGAGTKIHIQVRRLAISGVIAVSDGGIGIAKTMQNKIFNRFERAVSHQNISGLGLGLYITKQIVDAHHGSIHVSSDLGHGATFIVEFPGEGMKAISG